MDPIADMIVIIKNGYLAKKDAVVMSYSKFKQELAKVLEKAGYIGKSKKEGSNLAIELAYNDGKSKMHEIKKVSKSGLRIYIKSKKIRPLKGGKGIYIISTPQGVMASNEAKKKNLGGEVICQVW
ncbi:MAG: 30S ribosomal protein S8 [Candidatus Curtissbacteria bacterium GW2011_GWA1_40_9]|uniref:Small ribosomal subunit protein uS8 n=1 Tax=Candidatus Curtissbacteria bacterium GW2011_GWA1_40_9 TaxID=1618408 RepID=A0A0G0TT52_9BACT|nr:MAG: 30S ribosomal protein S8 [Candidatus Curtissbacteria bacterium GW2011_GWA1_40_9]